MEEILTNLREQGIVLTHQRLAVLELLVNSENHPTAKDIYKKLRKKYPTISQATVYSTLELLKKVGQVRELNIRGDKACYDPVEEPHYHLLCRSCQRVLDVETPCPPLGRELPAGHRVDEVRLYLYGICSDCLGKSEN